MLPLLAALPMVMQSSTYTLDIGRSGTVAAEPGSIVETSSGERVSLEQMIDRVKNSRFVYIGESHTSAEHHRLQADVIDRLAAAGKEVIVGFEMFTRPVQSSLNGWTLGWWSEEEFMEKSEWKTQWGFDYALYKPIFDAVRKHRLPMVALNVPRDWVRAVGRGGYEALTPEQRGQLPALDAPHPRHRELFNSMMGGHPPTGSQGENIFNAQNLWDIAMADSAVKYLQRRYVGPNTVFVILAGSGHIMYNTGIPFRVNEYLDNPRSSTIICIDSNEPLRVARGIGDFVFVSRG